jgi:RHS repeat-associated protein
LNDSAGKERDAETGLDYFLARYYSGAQGRFLSPDEFKGGIVDPFTGKQISQPGPLPYADIWDPQTLNKYGYVRNNPLRYVDPDGHDFWDFINGAANAFSTDFVAGVGRQTSNGDYSQGQKFGDAAAIVVGGIETIVGGGGEVGGLALDATGVGAAVGVPAGVVSTAAIVQGGSAVTLGASNLMQSSKLPNKTVVQQDGVKITHNTASGDHGPAHLHVQGEGPNTRIGQNGKPLKNNPELSPTQRSVVDDNIKAIRNTVKSIMKWFRLNNE